MRTDGSCALSARGSRPSAELRSPDEPRGMAFSVAAGAVTYPLAAVLALAGSLRSAPVKSWTTVGTLDSGSLP